MAKKVITEEVPVAPVEEFVPVEEVKETPVVAPKYAEPPKTVREIPNVDDELKFAREQIEQCEDYVNVPGADHKGIMKSKLKEFREYKYKLRQYRAGLAPKPVQPAPVDDY